MLILQKRNLIDKVDQRWKVLSRSEQNWLLNGKKEKTRGQTCLTNCMYLHYIIGPVKSLSLILKIINLSLTKVEEEVKFSK